MRDYKDAECDWARSTDCVPEGATASGSVRFVTAAGKQLERGELVLGGTAGIGAQAGGRAGSAANRGRSEAGGGLEATRGGVGGARL
jgi:hypothetical protein